MEHTHTSNVVARAGRLTVVLVLAAAAVALSVWVVSARADTTSGFWTVCTGGPGAGCDFPSIQEAVDAAAPGDVIRVVATAT
jgi:hypothetical protein